MLGGTSRLVYGISLLALLAVVPGAWAADDDEGIKAGANTRFQPGVLVAGAYQSNVYRTESSPEGDITIRVEPHLRLVHSSNNAKFSVFGEYHLKKHTGAFVDQDTDPVGHKDLDIFLNYILGADLMTRPKSPFSFIVADQLSRLSREFDNADLLTNRYSRMDHLSNRFHIGVEGRPGSAFRIQGLFHFDLGRYTGASDQGVGAAADRRVYGQAYDLYGSLLVGWKFFPRTQLMLEADFGHILWDPTFQDLVSGGTSEPAVAGLNQYDSDHWRVWLGVQGQFSRKISLQAMIGYGNAYYPDSPEDPAEKNLGGINGLLGKAQFHWKPVPTHRLTVGFLRDYRFIYFSNYYVSNSPYVRYRGQIAGFLLPEAEFAYLLRTIAGDVDRTDHEIRVKAGVGFQIADFFEVGVGYRLWSIVGSTDADAQFMDHEVGLELEFGY